MQYLSQLVFLNKGFRIQPTFCNGCHDILMAFTDIDNIVISDIYGVDYCCNIADIS